MLARCVYARDCAGCGGGLLLTVDRTLTEPFQLLFFWGNAMPSCLLGASSTHTHPDMRGSDATCAVVGLSAVLMMLPGWFVWLPWVLPWCVLRSKHSVGRMKWPHRPHPSTADAPKRCECCCGLRVGPASLTDLVLVSANGAELGVFSINWLFGGNR